MLNFKNTIAYRVEDFPEAGHLSEMLSEHLFHDLESRPSSVVKTSGWVFFDSHSSPVVESNGVLHIALREEYRDIPASVVKSETDKRVSAIEKTQDRKIYRVERLNIRDEVVASMLQKAFIKHRIIQAVINPDEGFIFVDASSHSRAEQLLSFLRESLGSLKVVPVQVHYSVTEWMGRAMINNDSEYFAIGDECELSDPMGDGGKAVFKAHDLSSDEVLAHLYGGYESARLELIWRSKLKFVLHSDSTIHKLKLVDEYAEQVSEAEPEDETARLEYEIWSAAKMLTLAYRDIISAMGGDVERQS